MTKLAEVLEQSLISLREQAQEVPMINPPLTLAERLSQDLDQGKISLEDIEECLTDFSQCAFKVRANDARKLLKVDTENLPTEQNAALKAHLQHPKRWQYNLVFTAHPIFAFSSEDSAALARNIVDSTQPLPNMVPLNEMTLAEEHERAMVAIDHARTGLLKLNRALLQLAQAERTDWQETPLVAMNLASWVGYDLDGRDDIRWIDSFCFRLEEKKRILRYYHTRLEDTGTSKALQDSIIAEYLATSADLVRFRAYQSGESSLAGAANALTERADKVIDTQDWIAELRHHAQTCDNGEHALEAALLAGEMQQYGLGIGEIHLRLNALQIRNAMRAVDLRDVSESRRDVSSRRLMDILNGRIKAVEPEEVNFHDLDTERATARRLMMLSKQMLKHIDAKQPIRLLVAECEKHLTLLSALYLAKLYKVSEKLDISPLFETRLGLERGAEIIEQLLQNAHYQGYICHRGRLAVQTGFSDAGRFIGQLPATLAIERLHIKLAEVHHSHLPSDVALLIFNTHGESMGRGCARGSVANRQQYIFSPHAREQCANRDIAVIHESSFQGGDGFVWFHDPDLAACMILRLFEAEFASSNAVDDPLYTNSDFSIDVFLRIKNWQDRLFSNPDYGSLLDLFGSNILPKTGSRPTKRASSSMGNRQDPSKIRAIAHNARLQQVGFLANVIGGLGHASGIDPDRFEELYQSSARMRQLVHHAIAARRLGSTTTVLAYSSLFRRDFWIARAYQTGIKSHVRSCRNIADALYSDTHSDAISRLITVIRDDLLDLRAIEKRFDPLANSVQDRILIDSLQVLRLVMIMKILMLVSRVPRFAEHSAASHADLIRLAIRLEVDTIVTIIQREFGLDAQPANPETFVETGRASSDEHRYQSLNDDILIPLKHIYGMVKHVTMVIGCLYGAHG